MNDFYFATFTIIIIMINIAVIFSNVYWRCDGALSKV